MVATTEGTEEDSEAAEPLSARRGDSLCSRFFPP
jgi:hypothetical protein